MLVSVSGPSCSGKTTACAQLAARLPGVKIAIVGQDDFYRQDESFARVAGFDNWDAVDAIEWDRVAAALAAAQKESDIVLLEGIHAFHGAPQADLRIHIGLDRETCRARRLARDDWLRENPAYFDAVLWPEHIAYCRAHVDGREGVLLLASDAHLAERLASACSTALPSLCSAP